MSRVVKRTIKWGLLAIFVYVAIGWIVKDIYFSICEWQPDETFVEVWRREIKVYTIVAAIISGIFALNCCLSDTSLSFGRTYTRSDIYWGIPMGIFFAVFYGKDYIPMSTGAGLLVNILNIIAMITPIYGLFVIENENDNKKKNDRK